jgi:hypothetical protein
LYVFVWITAQRLILGTVDSILLYQSILAISSATSALWFISFLQKGIVRIQSFSSIQRLFNIVRASFLVYFLPIKLLIKSISNGTVTIFCLCGYKSE